MKPHYAEGVCGHEPRIPYTVLISTVSQGGGRLARREPTGVEACKRKRLVETENFDARLTPTAVD